MKRYDSNPFSGSGYGLLNMLIKCQLRIECQTEMFMFEQRFNDDVIKKYGMGWFILFAREYHLNCFLIHIRVKLHFPLESPLLNWVKIVVQDCCRGFFIIHDSKRELSSAKCLASELVLSIRSLMLTKKIMDLKQSPGDTWGIFPLSTACYCLSDKNSLI